MISSITNAQKAAFAIANKLAGSLKKTGIDRIGLCDYIKQKDDVDSMNGMTEQQWTELSAELKGSEMTSKHFETLCQQSRYFF